MNGEIDTSVYLLQGEMTVHFAANLCGKCTQTSHEPLLCAAAALQVIYSLNMKNEEQEAALEALSYAHHEELHRILMETCHEGEGSALRTRLLDLQESLEEQHRVGAQVCVCVCGH